MKYDFFKRAGDYRKLVSSPARAVREKTAAPYSFNYSERHLQCLWFDSAIRPEKLISSDGELVRIDSPGRWNLEPGPDFLDAVLTIGPEQRKIKGDIEVHIHPRDWINHGHSSDPRYNNVIAHATYLPGVLPPETFQRGVVQISLGDAVKAMPWFSFENIDVTAYPYSCIPESPAPCLAALKSRGMDFAQYLLDSAGEERLRIKSVRMAEQIAIKGGQQAFYEETMYALGYKQNRIPFRQLANRIPLQTLRTESQNDPAKAYALLLGVAGLLPRELPPETGSETGAFVRTLWDHWWKKETVWGRRAMQDSEWNQGPARPQNHPIRRIASAAILFTREQNITDHISSLKMNNPLSWRRNINKFFKTGDALPYWRKRLTLNDHEQAKPVALLGSQRIAGIISNVIIPFLAATDKPVSELLDALPEEQSNIIIKQAASALFGPDHNPALYNTGLRQQGLIQIFHDFCLNNRTGCSACALAQSLQENRIPDLNVKE